ncbi:phage/plasmid primase, P4 family [Sporosarcina sp.]|uniref:phage/plasmid primase, P4 family n=1 Tax=Sporosarcina sp. TaxID=49982 RepID=UPI0026223CF7|nr:phage/plasmid primase, P4 family [Sporosarcina sp.]
MFTNIPEEMRMVKQWVCYKTTPRGNKITKVPVNPINGIPIDSNKRENWFSFEEAIQYIGQNVISGVGFVFTEDDDFVGIDIDECFENGEFNQIAEEILCNFEGKAYAEFSPSGKGIHLITKGTKETSRSKNSNYGLEIYQSKRYFTVTGNMIEGYTNIEWSSDVISVICRSFLEKGVEEQSMVLLEERKAPDDEGVLGVMFRSKNGQRLESLYDGEWEGYYPSQSEADLALCNALAFYTAKDTEEMDLLFRKSGLYRSKWDSIRYADGSTYGNILIQKAVEDTGDVFEKRTHKETMKSRKRSLKPEFPKWYMKGQNSLTFMPGILAKHIQSEETLLYSNEHFFEYRSGVYMQIDEQQIKKKIQSKLIDEHSKSSHVRDTLEQLKNRVWHDGDLFESPELRDKINFKNGLFNLQTGLLEKHTPDIFTSMQVNANYNEGSTSPVFSKFIESTLSEKDQLIAQEILGYLLVPETLAEKAFILYGPGRTGKSTFLKLIEFVLGKVNISNVALQDLSQQFKPSLLFGKLANIYADLPSKALQDTGIFKTLVSGDTIVAEEKFRTPFSFNNKARLLFSTNNLPTNNVDRTDGFYRRLIILPFVKQVAEANIDTSLQLKLQKEVDGIIQWGLRGLERLRSNNYQFTKSDTTEELLFEYKKQSNNVIWFVTEQCELNVTGQERSQDLYNHYKKKCLENNMQSISQMKFNKSLLMEYGQRIQKSEDPNKRVLFKGISIKKTS